MKTTRETCGPRPEVLESDLQDAIFAADFGHVVDGLAPEVYQDARTFDRNTHPAKQLKSVVGTVFGRLANPHEAGAAIRLSTGFGGGKTHTLIALWHLAKNVQDPTLGTELLPAAGRPKQVNVAGLDARGFGKPICATHPELQTHSLWGELAYRLSGVEGYRRIESLDQPDTVPDVGTIRSLFPAGPVLILLDELVMYMGHLQPPEQKAVLSFVANLIAEAGARPQTVLVISDTSGQAVYEAEAKALADASVLAKAAQDLDEVLGRKVSDYNPIAGEGPEVIARRLFEYIDAGAAQEASAQYYSAYQRVIEQYPEALPPHVATHEYAHGIVRCYPFHPRLMETAQDRLGALQDFNRARGVLRLFARIVRDVWGQERDLHLITGGDIDWSSPRIQGDLLTRLKREPFQAAVSADVVDHAGRLDQDYETDIHRRVATALLLESLPLTSNAAMDKRELTLATLRPSEVGHEPGEAMDRLMSQCWHTYHDSTARRFQFRYEPNINKIIEERADGIDWDDALATVHTLIQNYFGGPTLQLVPFPSSPKAVSDTAKLKLVLADDEAFVQAVCDYQDDSDPDAKVPRRFRNAIFGVAATQDLLHDAVQQVRRLKAAEGVLAEEQQKTKGKKKSTPLLTEVEGLLPGLRGRVRFRVYRAYDRLVLPRRSSVPLPEKYLVSDENALASVHGQTKLKDYLDDHDLVFKPGESIDVGLLVSKVVQGATPSVDHEGAVLACAVHERALESPHLRLLLSADPVRDAVLRAVEAGKLVVRLANGDAYGASGRVNGSEGQRHLEKGVRLSALSLTSDVLVAPADATCVAGWLHVDEQTVPDGEVPRIAIAEAAEAKGTSEFAIEEAVDLGALNDEWTDGVHYIRDDGQFAAWQPGEASGDGSSTGGPTRHAAASTWKQALEYAAKRPLVSLTLRAQSVAGANKLLSVAQPLGASELTLSVVAGGTLKEGGQVNFAVHGARFNTPVKPLEVAQRLLRATEDGSESLSAELTLAFDGPQTGAEARLQAAQQTAGALVTPEARFGPEIDDA